MWWFLAACDADVQRAEGPPPPRHGDGWASLGAAVERGDVPAARDRARDVVLGDHDDEKVGGALGFLQVAEDAGEVRDAFDIAQRACDACHERSGVDYRYP